MTQEWRPDPDTSWRPGDNVYCFGDPEVRGRMGRVELVLRTPPLRYLVEFRARGAEPNCARVLAHDQLYPVYPCTEPPWDTWSGRMPDYDLRTSDPLYQAMLMRGALRHVLGQRGDAVCWRDVYELMAACLPDGPERLKALRESMPPKPVMLHNCHRFVDALCAGRPQDYRAEEPAAIIAALQARVTELEAQLAAKQ